MIQINTKKILNFIDNIDEEFKKKIYCDFLSLVAYEALWEKDKKLYLFKKRFDSHLILENLKILGMETLIKNLENSCDEKFKMISVFYDKQWGESLIDICVSETEDTFFGAIYYKENKVLFE